MTSKRSSAFTLVELLVVIAIIGMLAALALPAINSAVRAARRTTCSNNQREFGNAIRGYATRRMDTYPGYRKIAKDNSNVAGGKNRIVSWQVLMLPEMGRTDIYEAIQDAFKNTDPTANIDLTNYNGLNLLPFIELSACPEDFTITSKTDPVTSYVVNTGKWDDTSLVKPDNKFCAVFHDHALPAAGIVKFSSSDIKDGAATTLLLSENMDSQYYMEPDAGYLKNNSERGTGFLWWTPTVSGGNLTAPDPVAEINGGKSEFDAAWPTSPTDNPRIFAGRPSSEHIGGVVVTYCAGNTDFLRDDIDYVTYCRLLAPNDAKTNSLPNGVLNESDFK